jgi:hypothetical protein
MRWWVLGLVFVSVGCSNAPLAGFLDLVRPAKFQPDPGRDPVDSPPAGVLLPPQGPASIPPTPTPGPFQPAPFTPDGTSSPGPLRVPNT